MLSTDSFVVALTDLGIHAAIQSIQNPGLHFDLVDAVLTRGAAHQRYTVVLNRPGRLEDITRLRPTEDPVLLFVDHITPRTATALHNAGLQYADLKGNAWIEFAEVLIDIRGRNSTRELAIPESKRAKRAGQVVASNIFSATRSQVVFALLNWPRLWTAPRRDLAMAAGVSVGLAHDTLTRLRETGLDHDDLRPALPGLLDRWAMAFSGTTAKRLTVAAYRGDLDAIWEMKTHAEVFISGEAAATDLLRPASAVLYAQDDDPKIALANRWRTDGFANIIVRRKFWQDPDSLFQGAQKPRRAPWPLVYADLLNSDEPRVRDSAVEWKDRFAKDLNNGR